MFELICNVLLFVFLGYTYFTHVLEAKVPKSYHVLLTQDGVYYSVPHRLVNRRVEVRWTATKVEVFCGGERAQQPPDA